MFANPEVSAFIDRLIGGQTPRGGTPPQSQGYRDTLARSLLGDITQPSIRAPNAPPAIEAFRRPIATPAPSVGVNRGTGSQEQQENGNRGSSIGTNAGALSAGIENIGRGIEGGLDQLAANKQAAGKVAALQQGNAFPEYDSVVSGDAGAASTTNLPAFARSEIPGDYLAKVAAIENPSGSPYATSSTGATGKYQFIPSTWRQFGVGNIHDPAAQDAAMQRLTQANYNTLQAGLGRAPTDGELYLAHQQGAAGALKLLQNPATPAGQLVGSRAISVNGGNPNAPASAFVNKWGSRFGGAQTYSDQFQDRQQDAAPVIHGQSNPHVPGFDASSVPFINTPIGQQSMLPQTDPLALALANGQMPPIDPNFGGSLSGLFG